MLVYTRGQGVHGFTLDVGVGEFLLSNESMRCPDRGTLVAADIGRYPESPHQQVPLVIGSRENVAEYERFQASSALA
jgi:fructose-1,6-bisphosphatase